jgi:sulfatase modifying factor 1
MGDTVAARAECLGEEEALLYVSSVGTPERDFGLERHLDSCDSCRVMLAEAARALSDGGPAWEAERTSEGALAPPTSLAAGEVLLDRYTIVRFVARGGMGEVYEAYDDVLHETVALKTIVCTDLDHPAAMQRFRAEVRLARQVTHPNVCRIYEFGMHLPRGHRAEPVPFLTMEFLRGSTLDRRLAQEGRLDEAEVARLIPHMTAGLGAIHAAGIIHRDIKPANMALLPGPPERLVLMDFGLARAAKAVDTSQSLSGGGLVGTVDYMAPEQVAGQSSSRSIDIYSLGLVIFEMLTGQRPFAGSNVLATAVERMTLPPPRVADLVPGLDPAWDLMLARCLAPHAAQRYSRADEIVPPAIASSPGTPRPVRRRPWLAPVMAPGAVLVALVALVAGAALHRHQTRVPTVAAAAAPIGGKRAANRGNRAFTASGCSADMVRVADQFCVDRYEGSAVATTSVPQLAYRADLEGLPVSPFYAPSPDLLTLMFDDWKRRVEGGTTGMPTPLPEVPAWERELHSWRPRAVSKPNVIPQGYATQIIAAVACANAGKRLCTTEEWRTACRGEKGTRFPYGPTYQAGMCNVSRDEHPAEMLHIDYTDGLLDPRMNQVSSQEGGPLLRPTGATPTCASRWGTDAVYDMVGNLDEWSSDPRGVILGGFYSRPTDEGCDATNARHSPAFFNYSLGIRCCDRLH